ncbi:enoyl-CoA hydratase/isomerase family protein [Shewanella litorisediminis]|uniref:3-hydroxyisobutyryl-CoA hydrolase n=1 Tax=Shewanella litorisediminis TaxID=1173586 RepID=A0ABX7G768_9GAMM|nr:enoyl-CoA hydratase/isomerase family protein [Shewanella litorisediminis]MCL2916727.1 enoyl-CoA hydratase/isomerase family protein [Shewanella litorisediminis]QRH03103.1 enoyl-CoA hydratase/isomerase family protein [Shewanella litorisediminis]
MTQKVVFQTLGTASGKQIGVATLNVEAALNALDLDMVRALTAQLKAWQADDDIAMVMLDGAGDKAFCAGGDVRALYQASKEAPGSTETLAKTFFEEEYRLDYFIHEFGKPFMVWGDGIVMGGGLGLMAGASHRIATERSRIAMPEITIGLYPDVGGTFFLAHMPEKTGVFLGLTAFQMNGADALYAGTANFLLESDDKEPLLDALAEVAWDDNSEANHQRLSDVLGTRTMPEQPSFLKDNAELICELCSGSLETVIERFKALPDDSHKSLLRARDTLLAGSPLSAHLVWHQAIIGEELSLNDCFRWELGVSVNCCAHGDFVEGVRALLIDKDRNPIWQYADVASVPAEVIGSLLSSPWQGEQHPLQDL